MPDHQPSHPHSSSSDEALMAVVCTQDDAQAFAELMGRWRDRVIALCFRLTGDRQDAEEATQDAFSKAYLARSQYQGNGKFSTWLWRIAINTAHDIHRRRKPAQTNCVAIDQRCADDGPQQQTQQAEQRELVRQAINQLNDEHRTVLILRHYEQLRFREIAELLDIPQGTVASRMAEALSQLGRILKQHSDQQ
jgi:RNA polymerase sigma-70 factor (ECF subfamily)